MQSWKATNPDGCEYTPLDIGLIKHFLEEACVIYKDKKFQ